MNSYIHIPFCESKCKYCRFASIWNLNQVLVDKYVKHLLLEIDEFTYLKPLETLYFGGGTPSILSEKNLISIVKKLENKFSFSKNIEITLETTPQNINISNLNIWYNLWINRISFWVQSLNNDTLKAIWRTSKETILEKLELLKNSKIQNISIDFIIGLPYVKKWWVLDDIKYILEKYDFIKHISVYMLEDYYEVEELENSTKFDNIVYPENWSENSIKEDEYLNEYLEILNYLKSKWFNRYELSNFAKSWYECNHNKWYWEHSECAGFGLWAHSFINNTRYANSSDFKDYYNKKLEYKEDLKEKDIFLEKVMFWFRTNWISQNIYKNFDKEKLSDFIKNEYLEIIDKKLVITNKSFSLIDYIISELI